jgi:hypothetical protein
MGFTRSLTNSHSGSASGVSRLTATDETRATFRHLLSRSELALENPTSLVLSSEGELADEEATIFGKWQLKADV